MLQIIDVCAMRTRLFRHLHQSSVIIQIPRVPRRRFVSSIANPTRDISHSEEPLGLPASEGFGYFQGGPGLILGPNSRFKLQAKLGFGTTSSVWLARDLMYDSFRPDSI
jgi:hypothetical protein